MNTNIAKIEPVEVWSYFSEILRIPRPSKKEERIVNFLVEFANKHNLPHQIDETGNVLITKPATKGMENHKTVCLQSHMDMVCEKNKDKEFDFEKDVIKAYIDGDWVKADGTTLGADDGIGIATQLAILASNTIEHGPIECLFTVDEETGLSGAFGLKPGFGITIGNALRRILLSSLEGFAITTIKIEGVDQEFSTIKGVVEDVVEIVLNLKQIRFKRLIEQEDSESVKIVIKDQEVFKAGDLNKYLSVFQVLNPDLVLCNMDPSVTLTMDMTINKGRGYVPAEENKLLNSPLPLGTIAIDSIHTPIVNVKYNVEDYRVEQKTDYEKLLLEIITDGSIHPKDALKEAARILIIHFMLFSDERIAMEKEDKSVIEEFDETALSIRQVLKTKLVDLNLSVRALNCLKAADIETLGELVTFNKNDLLKFRNFGKKSLAEIEELFESKNLEFGMNVAKYKLDKK